MEPAFRRLPIWQKAHQLALDVATATFHFPEKQLERADHANDRLEVPLIVAQDLGFLSEIEAEHLLASCKEVQRMFDRQLIALQRKRTKR